MPEDLLRETGRFLHEQIPLTAAMGVVLEAWDGETLVITAPLAPNHNHLGTAFGGSLAAMATLAGYALLWLTLGRREAHVVIRSSELHYRRPVRGPIRAICRRPAAPVLQAFEERYRRSGKAGLEIPVTIEEEGSVCVAFRGVFVALAGAPPP